jgi:enoyl-CoA hydratase/carnithine racemase
MLNAEPKLHYRRLMNAAEQFQVHEVSGSYWRVIFDNGPVNLLDPDTLDQLAALIGRIEDDQDLTVVVFASNKPGYFMAHWDFLAATARRADGSGAGRDQRRRLGEAGRCRGEARGR